MASVVIVKVPISVIIPDHYITIWFHIIMIPYLFEQWLLLCSCMHSLTQRPSDTVRQERRIDIVILDLFINTE